VPIELQPRGSMTGVIRGGSRLLGFREKKPDNRRFQNIRGGRWWQLTALKGDPTVWEKHWGDASQCSPTVLVTCNGGPLIMSHESILGRVGGNELKEGKT